MRALLLLTFVLAGSVEPVFALPNSFVDKSLERSNIIHIKATKYDKDRFEGQSKIFIQELADEAIAFLSADLSIDKKKKKFETLLNDKFDMRTIARFSMGRYFRLASDAQKKEYFSLFDDMIIDVYSKRFGEYTDEKLEVVSANYNGKNDAIVNTRIVPKSGAAISIDWRVRLKDNKYQIVDVVIEGISMAVTNRSEFASIIERGGGRVDALIEHLKNR